MSNPPSAESRFHLEVFKLLLQVISSDGHVAPEELRHFTEAARSWNVPDAEVAALLDCLREGTPLPAPDMGLLRLRPDAAISAAQALIASDQHIDSSEIEVIRQIRELLGA
jgi:uncharacterized tellurite resistance protein B-like protein